MAFVASYPPFGRHRPFGEGIGVGDTVKIFGGGMVGLQYTPIMQASAARSTASLTTTLMYRV